MMEDFSVNFYTVCDSADAYFKTIDITKKGTGYKQYLRWKNNNESKYYPTGNRLIDHYTPQKEYARIQKETNNDSNNRNTVLTNSGWIELGPFQVGQITGHYAPGLGRMEYVEPNRLNNQQIYLGTRSGGLWRTSNGGQTWSRNTNYLPGSGVNAIGANPSNFNEVLINCRTADIGISFGVYRSTDGGNTFTATNFVPSTLGTGGLGSSFRINIIKYHPTIPNLVFIGTDRGVYRSTNNLSTWTRINNSWNVKEIEFHPTNNNIVYVYENYYWGTNKNKIHISNDQGLTYTSTADFAGNADASIRISTNSSNPNYVYLMSDNGIWKSTDSGQTFTPIRLRGTDTVGYYGGVVNDTNISNFVFGYLDLYNSTDEGTNHNQVTYWSLGSSEHGTGDFTNKFNNSTKYIHADNNFLRCVNGIFYSCTDGFLSSSSDQGVTWNRLINQASVRENYCLGVSQSNHYKTICGAQDNGTIIKNETNWIEYYGADGMEGIIHPLNDNYMVGSFQNGGRIKTINGGLNNFGATPPGQTASWVAPMFYDPNDQMTIYSLGINVHKSTNFGESWTTLGTSASFSTSRIENAAIAENDSNKIIITNDSNIDLSNDGGLTFTSIKSNLPNLWIADVVFDPNNDNRIIVVYNGYQNNSQKIYMTENSGASWQNITYNLGNMPIHSVVISNTDTPIIYIGAEIGVYKKTLSATTWSLFNTNLPNVTVKELEINYATNTLRAATWGNGLWETKLDGRSDFPEIINTSITSNVTTTSPIEGIQQYITSTINYSGTLSKVYIEYAIGTPTFNGTNIISMYNELNNIWKSNSALPNSTAGTKIFFKVIAIAENGDTTKTYKFMYSIKPNNGYCSGVGSSSNGNLYINSFTCNGYTNTSNSNNTYTYYSSSTINLSTNNTYTATGNFNTGWADNDFVVWIDYNQDLTFTADERVIMDGNTGSQGTGSFTVPANAVSGNTRMRVRLGYWGGFDNPCDSTLGEVEDYLVTISNANAPSITYTGNYPYCSGSNEFTYTGTTANTVTWTIQQGTNVYYFTGNTINVSNLPNGIYSMVVCATINGITYKNIFSNCFEISTTTWNGTTWSNGNPEGKTAIFNSSYSLSSDLTVCSVQVSNNSTLNVPTGKTLTVENQININTGSLINIENNGAVVQINNVVNTGNTIAKRNSTPMVRLDYTAWSSPVLGQNLLDFSPNTITSRFYEYLYTGTSTATAYQSVPNVSTTPFTPAKGYMIRTANNWSTSIPTIYNGQFSGVLNNGNYSQPLGIGYNLIGNPYPSPISANLFLDANTNIGTLYFWTHKVAASGGVYPLNNYASYTKGLGGVAAAAGGEIPNGYIQTGQGFFINTTNSGIANFKNNQRVNASLSSQFFRNSTNANNTEKHRFWLNLNNESNAFNQILLGYSSEATNEYDQGIDGELLDSTHSLLYSTINENKYVIQGRKLPFNTNDVIPLGIKILTSGTYSIQLEQFDGLFENQDIFINDKVTNIITSLKNNVYNFFAESGIYDNRFEIIFNNSLLNQEQVDIENTVIYTSDNVIHIFSDLSIDEVEIYDVIGRTLYHKKNVNAKEYKINSIIANNQTLIVKVKNTTGKLSTKKIIL